MAGGPSIGGLGADRWQGCLVSATIHAYTLIPELTGWWSYAISVFSETFHGTTRHIVRALGRTAWVPKVTQTIWPSTDGHCARARFVGTVDFSG